MNPCTLKMELDQDNTFHDELEAFDEFEIVSLTELKDLGPLFSIPSLGSDTMDVALKYNQVQSTKDFPDSPRGPPPRNCHAGDLNFVVEVNSKDVHKKTFLYSHRLCRIYVDMKFDFSIQFNWDYARAPHMFVRATVVFSDEAQAEKRVEKCVQHYQEGVNANLPPEIAKNVLQSSRELGTAGVYYCGRPALPDSWYSVLVEFRRAGPQPAAHAFRFMCKNSCTTGINRRAIAIIFTLEDQQGKVYGLQKIGTRVCACPRRDMIKDEESEGIYKTGKKRIPSNQIEPTKTKKVKIEKTDNMLTLPPLRVSDTRTMVTGLEVMLSMMRQAADLRATDPQAPYAACIAGFEQYLEQLKSVPPPPPQ